MPAKYFSFATTGPIASGAVTFADETTVGEQVLKGDFEEFSLTLVNASTTNATIDVFTIAFKTHQDSEYINVISTYTSVNNILTHFSANASTLVLDGSAFLKLNTAGVYAMKFLLSGTSTGAVQIKLYGLGRGD